MCDKRTRFYTRLPNYGVFRIVFNTLEQYLPFEKHQNSKLSNVQVLTLTLMKLRLGCTFTDLAYRFDIDIATASKLFYRCLNILYNKFKSVIKWPTRDELYKTMPTNFRDILGHRKLITIIDCFEVFTEHPSNPLASAQCWSTYKHHQTLKFLIGITPQGSISFISKAYGGRCSDKFVTEDCGILNKLIPGDVVMADRGFNMETEFSLQHTTLLIPAFVKGQSQLHPVDVEMTRRLASLRVHVERVIGSLRQKYEILSNRLPISTISKFSDEVAVTDQIVLVCSALVNFCPSIIISDKS